ncbi:MAG TPA: hypothetical protein ENK05_09625 [Gammaproteobacteria bacterium]|nr:hypothetical protein [Gammaproteobacteria bacterium]
MKSTCLRLIKPALIVAATTALLFGGAAHAELPASADVLPTGADDEKPISTLTYVLLWGGQIFAILLGLSSVGYSGFSIVTSFGEASKRGEWGSFISTAIFGVVLVGIGITLAVLLFNYASTFTADVTVN